MHETLKGAIQHPCHESDFDPACIYHYNLHNVAIIWHNSYSVIMTQDLVQGTNYSAAFIIPKYLAISENNQSDLNSGPFRQCK